MSVSDSLQYDIEVTYDVSDQEQGGLSASIGKIARDLNSGIYYVKLGSGVYDWVQINTVSNTHGIDTDPTCIPVALRLVYTSAEVSSD